MKHFIIVFISLLPVRPPLQPDPTTAADVASVSVVELWLFSFFTFLALSFCVAAAWFYRTLCLLYSQTSSRPLRVYCKFIFLAFSHLSVYIYISVGPPSPSVTQYPLFSSSAIICPVLRLNTSFPLLLSLHTHTAAIYYIASVPLLLSWWNCLSVFCWLHLFFLQLRTLLFIHSLPFSLLPLPSLSLTLSRSRLPPHISFHLSRQSASWLTYSQVGEEGKWAESFCKGN